MENLDSLITAKVVWIGHSLNDTVAMQCHKFQISVRGGSVVRQNFFQRQRQSSVIIDDHDQIL